MDVLCGSDGVRGVPVAWFGRQPRAASPRIMREHAREVFRWREAAVSRTLAAFPPWSCSTRVKADTLALAAIDDLAHHKARICLCCSRNNWMGIGDNSSGLAQLIQSEAPPISGRAQQPMEKPGGCH